MKLNFTSDFLACFFSENESINHISKFSEIEQVAIDSRKVFNPTKTLFFALIGEFRDGHEFIKDAYEKGVRNFCVSKNVLDLNLIDANFYLVKNTLKALQKLASFHRSQFDCPIIAITGSVGKTTVKEWLYHFLSDKFHIVRSPKSYNSQIGVALSLFELHPECQLAIIEAGISEKNEMQVLREMIQPNFGVFTAFGKAHEHNFFSKEEHLFEKELLFINCELTFVSEEINSSSEIFKKVIVKEKDYKSYLKHASYQDKATRKNLSLCISISKHFGLNDEEIIQKVKTIQRLALRMETFEGKNGNTIINDTYNADLDALKISLEHQKSISNKQKRVALIGVLGFNEDQIKSIESECLQFDLDELILFRDLNQDFDFDSFQNKVILIKGTRLSQMQKIVSKFRLKKHQTHIEINLSALKNNLTYWKNQLQKDCKLLVMVKASAYGNGSEKIARFLELNGVNYLGVAYIDEGVELRKNGINLPILVMNVDQEGYEDLIQFNLEPALYSFSILESFLKFLIEKNIENYPVHIKFDTGMRRLGFESNEANRVIDSVQTQPEIKIHSLYSHLADSDNVSNSEFTLKQIASFNKIIHQFENRLPYKFLKHLCNSEAIQRYPQAQYDMVRLGIGLYGIIGDQKIKKVLEPVISWKSIVSQVKTVQKGESIGYGQKFIAIKETTFAIIPVGYADGFKRNLGLGKGGVFIQNKFCKTLGNVCMDMIMVDVTNLQVKEGNEVEIIGKNQSVEDLATASNTIPYEILTSFSNRIHRVYIEGETH